MTDDSLLVRIISGRAGVWAGPVRGVLWLAERAYAAAIRARNARYDRRGADMTVSVPVISVGNITVGGTGKTPLVVEVARRLERMGRSPAVVARGYGAADGAPNDEERLIRRRCPGVVCVFDPDRVAAAAAACERFGADVVVLDDGFQHRRLGRDLDIVVVDATCPFGYERLLPRGLLREPVASLRRADLIVVTRCNQVAAAALARIEERVAHVAADVAHIRSHHAVTGIRRLDGGALDGSVEGRRAMVFAAIGRPGAFATTVRALGVEIVESRWWPDHHRYRRGEVERLVERGQEMGCELVLTTEKDAVKLAELDVAGAERIGVVEVSIDFEGEGSRIIDRALEAVLAGHEPQPA